MTKYYFSEKEIAKAYKKHYGNYNAMARELLPEGFPQGGTTLKAYVKRQTWGYKYPGQGRLKYEISEKQFAEAYERHNGYYSEIGKEFFPDYKDKKTIGNKLKDIIDRCPWGHKYPPRGVSGGSKGYIRKEKSYVYEISEKQFSDSYKRHNGNYEHMASEFLNPEFFENYVPYISSKSAGGKLKKIIRTRPWAYKYPPKGSKKINPYVTKNNPQNILNVNDIENFIKKGIKDKKITDEEVIKWLHSTFRRHLINVVPSDDVKILPLNAPDWAKAALKKNELKRAIISTQLKNEYYHVLDFILSDKPKLGSALEILAKVKKKDEQRQRRRLEFEERARRSKKPVSITLDEIGKIEFIYKFSDGFSIVSLLDDKSKDWEGVVMGHCVGESSYDEDTIYSLRDAEMMPHATMEINKNKIVQIQGKENKPVVEKYHNYIYEFLKKFPKLKLDPRVLSNIGLMKIENGKIGQKKIDGIIKIKDFYKYEGLTIKGTFYLEGVPVQKLPKGLVVENGLILENTKIKKLPDDISVGGKIEIYDGPLEYLPENLEVNDALILHTIPLKKLPDSLIVNGNLYLHRIPINKLPEGLFVSGSLSIISTPIDKLPNKFFIGKDLSIMSTNIKNLPDGLSIKGNLEITYGKLEILPEYLSVKGDLEINNFNMKKLPKGLSVGGKLDIYGTSIIQLPEDIIVKKDVLVNDSFLIKRKKPSGIKGKIFTEDEYKDDYNEDEENEK